MERERCFLFLAQPELPSVGLVSTDDDDLRYVEGVLQARPIRARRMANLPSGERDGQRADFNLATEARPYDCA